MNSMFSSNFHCTIGMINTPYLNRIEERQRDVMVIINVIWNSHINVSSLIDIQISQKGTNNYINARLTY